MGPTPKASGLGVGAVMAVVAEATLLLLSHLLELHAVGLGFFA